MLSISALLAKNNVDNFKNRDYRNFKVDLEQAITDASQQGKEDISISIPENVDNGRMVQEIEESGFKVMQVPAPEGVFRIMVSWRNPSPDDVQI